MAVRTRLLPAALLGVVVWSAGCELGGGTNNGIERLGAGAACDVSTQCGPDLRCVDGVCTELTCRDSRDCPGVPNASCAMWACSASRCVPGCRAPVVDSGVSGPVARDASVGCDPRPRPPKAGDLVLNEFLADPHGDLALGDANADGTRSASEDEFVEIGNTSTTTLDLNRILVSDADRVRHEFAGTSLGCGQVVVVFGGGDEMHASWRSNWEAASRGELSFNNGGDTINVGTSTTTPGDLATYGFGVEAVVQQSLVRSRELDDTSAFVEHTRHPGAALSRFSPGVRVDGTEF